MPVTSNTAVSDEEQFRGAFVNCNILWCFSVQGPISVQSTPVISRLLGAKIRERELSGSPVISRCRAKATTREFRITDPHSLAFTTLKQYVERWYRYLRFPDLYTHWHRTSDKSQQATLDFNNYATKLSNHTLCKATHDGFCVEISQTTSRLDRKQKWLHACAADPVRPHFTKVGWASRWQIRESHFK